MPSVWSWFSLRHPISNWLELPGHLVILFSNIHLLPLFFRLFTQVHLLIDVLVEGQYITLSGIGESRKAASLWGMMRGLGGVRKSIHQSWLAKELGLGLLCWAFKGVQEEIPREEASTLQIGSVAFPPGQCTSPQCHPCHRVFDQVGHQNSSSPSLLSRPCSLWLLVIP